MAHDPVVHAVPDVAGVTVRIAIRVGSAEIVAFPLASVLRRPAPARIAFVLRKDLRSIPPFKSQPPLVADHMNSGMESVGKDVTLA
jgi:hypothetical protein